MVWFWQQSWEVGVTAIEDVWGRLSGDRRERDEGKF